jgi:hypothetical protein
MIEDPEYRAKKTAATNARWAKEGAREAASKRMLGNKHNKYSHP